LLTPDCSKVKEGFSSVNLTGLDVKNASKLSPVLNPNSSDPAGPWSALGQGLDGVIHAMAVNGGSIYVGGNFSGVESGTSVSGLNNIARWDISEQRWYALDKGLNKPVLAIENQGNKIVVGGQFDGVGSGGDPVSGLKLVGKWDGSKWEPIRQGLAFGTVQTIAVDGQNIYLGGVVRVPADNVNIQSSCIIKWNGTDWEALDEGLNAQVHDIEVHSSGDVYAVGDFTNAHQNGTQVDGLNRIARWNGSEWKPLEKGLNGSVDAIAIDGDNIIVGGSFSNVAQGGTSVTGLNNIAKWNGNNWSTIGNGISSHVRTIELHGDKIYAGGDISTGMAFASNTTVISINNIVKWDGSKWEKLGNGLNSTIHVVKKVGNAIFAGGYFRDVGTGADHIPGLNHIAKWTLEQNSDNALHFDGRDDYVTAGNPIFYNGPFTLEGWYKPDLDSGTGALFNVRKGRMTGIYVEYMKSKNEEEGRLRFFIRNPPHNAGGLFVIPNLTVKAGEWCHIAAVKNTKGDISLYVNGEHQITKDGRHRDLDTGGLEVIFGYNVIGAPRAYKGLMDEVRIWTKAKSEAEIRAEMNTALQGNEPNLMLYYNFNQGQAGSDNSSINAIDNQASSSYKGTLQNFEKTGSDSNLLPGKSLN
ncbi:MAG: LamG domain-containing protein, partial [Bacteroidota bacterium]